MLAAAPFEVAGESLWRLPTAKRVADAGMADRKDELHAKNDFLLSEDVAELLGASRSTVQEWLGRCLIPHRKMPYTRRCVIPRVDFEAWLDGCDLETKQLGGGGRIVRPKGRR